MAIESKHPSYSERLPDWQQMRDTHGGQRRVKGKRFTYLPPTSGMVQQGALVSAAGATPPGRINYEAYLKRAVFPDLVKEAVEALIGTMHRKPPKVELPEPMARTLEKQATARNETLEQFLRRIHEEQLISGRAGIVADFIDEGPRSGEPYLALYEAETVINWDEGRRDGIEVNNLNLVVIDETSEERVRDFEWERVEKYRVLALVESTDPESPVDIDAEVGETDGGTQSVMNLAQGDGIYMTAVFRENDATFDPTALVAPMFKGSTLDEIPFVFVNTKDLVADPDDPPLLGLSNLALTIYRGEADYRQALYVQGQDTLVIMGNLATNKHGEDEPIPLGAGATIFLTQGSSAEFIGVDSDGLPEMRTALENDYDRAQQMSGKLLDSVSRQRESGEALHVRVAAKTATLVHVAKTGAAGLERLLKILARWMGSDPEQVRVEANTEFTDQSVDGKTVVDIMTGRTLGAPLALETIHDFLRERGVTKLTWDEELERMRAEREAGIEEEIGSGRDAGTTSEDDDGLEDDDDDSGDDDGSEDDGDSGADDEATEQ